ncbi:MAG: EAL domain-containing protein [Methylobacteriaceae bacterium]|nr:EAL domain-containing protein [Methylobacteriaceae bacterium]
MRGRQLRLALLAGGLILSAILVAGTFLVIHRTWQTAYAAAGGQVQRSVLLARTIVNRHLVQVDSALASLPALFASLDGPITPQVAQRLLRGINFQSFAFRDIVLLGSDGRVWASARSRLPQAALPIGPDDIAAVREGFGQTRVIGPRRNPATGDWALFLSRPVMLGRIGDMVAVAEVPLPSLVSLFGEGLPEMRVLLERGDGRLLASAPHDELAVGKPRANLLSSIRADGVAFLARPETDGTGELAAAFPTLYGDIRIAVTMRLDRAMASWARDRDRLLAGLLLVEILVLVSVAGLLRATRRQERLEAEREQAQTTLANAIEAMSDGFVMWDRDDRLIACNGRYRELYAISAEAIRPGATFEEVMRFGVARGQYPQAPEDVESWLQAMLAWHRNADGALERLLPDGRWLLVTERRTASGEIVGMRTDITALKAALTELEAANARARAAMEEVRQQNAALQEREGQIAYLAHHDALTGLANRTLFRERLDAMLRQGETERGVALLYLDLDEFKDVNDTLGHPVGDALLREVAERLKSCVREGDLVARLGGDEFAIACLDRDPRELAAELGERIIVAVSAPYRLEGRVVCVGTSVGIAVAGPDCRDPDTLGRNADMALYEAKAGGRGQWRFFEEGIELRLQARLDLERDLRAAVSARAFELAYQPIFDLGTGRVGGFEALLRWNHPERGWVSPAAFIPLAEQTGLIDAIGADVLRQACRDAAGLPPHLRMAVNLSPVQLRTDSICDLVAEALAGAGVEPDRLELEITETAFVEDPERVAATLRRLRELGVRLVLDDFGTGYSSLSYLRSFPLQKIKIDQSFVRDMTTRGNSAAIVSAIIGLAGQLGMSTTAEGIETPEHLELVRQAGCVEAQGYFLGRPKPILHAPEALQVRLATPGRGARRASA